MFENYIRIYENVFPPAFCDNLIKKYENNPQQYYYQDRKSEERDWKMSFSQIHLQDHVIWENDVKYLMETPKPLIEQYKKDCKIIHQWPDQFGFEPIRMKRYEPNDKDEFQDHVDVSSWENARRFLVMFVYLDNNEAGQTTFPDMDIVSPCKKGSVLMFPPMWPWTHAGKKPINKPKYIVGSYLQYETPKELAYLAKQIVENNNIYGVNDKVRKYYKRD